MINPSANKDADFIPSSLLSWYQCRRLHQKPCCWWYNVYLVLPANHFKTIIITHWPSFARLSFVAHADMMFSIDIWVLLLIKFYFKKIQIFLTIVLRHFYSLDLTSSDTLGSTFCWYGKSCQVIYVAFLWENCVSSLSLRTGPLWGPLNQVINMTSLLGGIHENIFMVNNFTLYCPVHKNKDNSCSVLLLIKVPEKQELLRASKEQSI